MNAFSLLISAVVAIALLSVIWLFVAPLFAQQVTLFDATTQLLDRAVLNEPALVNTPLVTAAADDALSARTFSERGFDIRFVCNSPQYCCDEGVSCSQGAVWTTSAIRFSQPAVLPLFARCERRGAFFACSVFFGQKPGELSFEDVRVPAVFDLAQTAHLEVPAVIVNQGAQPVFGILSRLDVWRLDETQKTLITSRELQSGDLDAGQTRLIVFDLIINRAGNYEFELIVSAPDGGTVRHRGEFQTINEPASLCRAQTELSPQRGFDISSNQCKDRYFCTQCAFAFQCADAWKKERPELEFELGDTTHAVVLSEPLNGACD